MVNPMKSREPNTPTELVSLVIKTAEKIPAREKSSGECMREGRKGADMPNTITVHVAYVTRDDSKTKFMISSELSLATSSERVKAKQPNKKAGLKDRVSLFIRMRILPVYRKVNNKTRSVMPAVTPAVQRSQ